jgi:hypothetical protein
MTNRKMIDFVGPLVPLKYLGVVTLLYFSHTAGAMSIAYSCRRLIRI